MDDPQRPSQHTSVYDSLANADSFVYTRRMLALKARVHNGRITMDEPTDLPDGTILDVVTMDPRDELDDQERAELHAAIEDGLSDLRAGRGIDGDVLLAELQAHG